MPRVGQNPLKWVDEVHRPKEITVTTIVHIPFLGGYWTKSLDVLKLCLESMRESTELPFDLMVFDNASCAKVKDCLLDLYRQNEIQYLTLSERNVGKVGAWNFLFAAAPGEVVSYTDSDVFFLPGWLEASMNVLETFPEAGMVSAQPGFGPLCQRRLNTLLAARRSPSVTIREGNDLIPEAYLVALHVGLGDREDQIKRENLRNRKDVFLTRGSTTASLSASHFQFTTTREVLTRIPPLKAKRGLGDVGQLDKALDDTGFWRLSTTDYLVHHMGNRVPDLQGELPWVFTPKSTSKIGSNPGSGSPLARFLENGTIRHFLKRINVWSYNLLYDRS